MNGIVLNNSVLNINIHIYLEQYSNLCLLLDSLYLRLKLMNNDKIIKSEYEINENKITEIKTKIEINKLTEIIKEKRNLINDSFNVYFNELEELKHEPIS
jgi:hypothetical protein